MLWKTGSYKNSFIISLISLFVVFSAYLVWMFFEKEPPSISVKGLPLYLSSSKSFVLSVSDKKMGLRRVKIELIQGKKEKVFFDKRFPYSGLLNREGIHKYTAKITLSPVKFGFSNGDVTLKIYAWDYSKRNGFKGNLKLFTKKLKIDTTPPQIVPLSRLNYFSIGGSGLITYEVSEDTVKTGIYLNKIFFPAYKVGTSSGKFSSYVCYIGIPYDIRFPVDFYIWAEDRAGNNATARFYYRIKKRSFRKRKIIITDSFLKKVLPFFSHLSFPKDASDIDKFLKINRELRKKNNQLIKRLVLKTSKKRLWKGAWIYLRNSKCTARFGDQRAYFYKGRCIDHQVHLGIDLASVANSPVPASNSGKVIYTGIMGIYGLAVIIDHGQGIFSLYGHLSRIDVEKGQEVKKGDIIGLTGQTGLAGGDHLHFSILVNGIFVNPEEWIDYHWLKNNILRKLKRIKGGY